MRIFRRYKLVVSAALMLAAIFFTPSAWCGDSASLASIGRSVGASRSAGGEFDKLAALPETIRQWFSGRGNMLLYKECVSAYSHLRTSGLSSVGVFNGQPCAYYAAFVTNLGYYNALVNSDGVVVKAWKD